jgi:hypothetical protein
MFKSITIYRDQNRRLKGTSVNRSVGYFAFFSPLNLPMDKGYNKIQGKSTKFPQKINGK